MHQEQSQQPQAQTIRCDPGEITPAYTTAIDYGVFERLGDEFTHRGYTVNIDRLKSYCMAGIENKGRSRDSHIVGRQKAIKIVCSALEARYPEWFNRPQQTNGIERSGEYITTDDLICNYFNGELIADQINVTSISDVRTVVIPLLGILLNEIEVQQQSDRNKAVNEAQKRIKQTIIEEAYTHELSDGQINKAIQDAHSILDSP